MFQPTYRSMMNQIRPSERLIRNTKDKFYTKFDLARHSPPTAKWTLIGTAAVCFAFVAVALPFLYTHQPMLFAGVPASSASGIAPVSSAPEIQTKLSSGAFVPQVRLKDGELNFFDSGEPQSNRKLYFDPKITHEEQWNPEQTVKYLGTDVRPAYLPEVLLESKKEAEQATQFVVMNNDGTAAYDNINYFYYADTENPNAPSLTVNVSKGKLPLECVLYRSKDQKESIVKGSKLLVGHEVMQAAADEQGSSGQPHDLYYAEFIYRGIGYRVVSKALPQEEFIKTVISLFQ